MFFVTLTAVMIFFFVVLFSGAPVGLFKCDLRKLDWIRAVK